MRALLNEPKLPLIAVCSSLLWLACTSPGTKENPIGAGSGGAGMQTGGVSGAMATGGAGGVDATGGMGSVAGEGGMAGMAGMGGMGGMGGADAMAGAGGMAGMDATGGMGGGDSGDDPNAVSENPDGVDPLEPLADDVALPIVFVHGFAGSAQQYDSQMQRFVANGYPRDRIYAYDHDGAGFDTGAYADGVDEVVDAALAEHGASKVYLVGHSRGTIVSSGYLGNSARAAKVAKYISLDGQGCLGVSIPCLEPTQTSLPGQAHVEVATSPESFEVQYDFLIGAAPAVVDIVPQKQPVEISGRAVNFPANTGRAGVTLQIWTLDEATGHRAASEPLATFEIAEDGEWGPATVDSRKRYEFTLVPSEGSTHHLYMQRFLRDSHFVRLLSGGTDSPTRMNTNAGPGHASLVLMRMREWYAGGGATGDVVEIGTTSPSAGDQAPVDIMVGFIGTATIGIHVHDAAASPGDTTLDALPYFSTQAFQSGIDVFMPATDPPDGTITITNSPRGDESKPQVVRVPNWPSSTHAISVLVADYPQ